MGGWQRFLRFLGWCLSGSVLGGLLGALLQGVTGTAGWALIGAFAGGVAIVFWTAQRDPRW
jgi:outer membrane lipoprotein SlyB